MLSGSIRVALGGDVLSDPRVGDAPTTAACCALVACSIDTDDKTDVVFLGGVAASVFSVLPGERGASSSTIVVPVSGLAPDAEEIHVSPGGDSPRTEGSGCRSCSGMVAVLTSLSLGDSASGTESEEI